MAECSRCGECCKYIALLIKGMSQEAITYYRTRGLEEDQGFFILHHQCQHLIEPPTSAVRHSCAIHEDPNRPFVCRKFAGQKRIRFWSIWIPETCAMRKK